jgi:hypothetical protein
VTAEEREQAIQATNGEIKEKLQALAKIQDRFQRNCDRVFGPLEPARRQTRRPESGEGPSVYTVNMTPEQRFERIENILEEHSVLIKDTEGRINAIAGSIEAVSAQQRDHGERIRALIDAQMTTTLTLNHVIQCQASADRGTQELRAAQKKTEEMLQAFIASLHKGGNGHS